MDLLKDATIKKTKKKPIKREDGNARINIKTYVYLKDRWAWEEPVSKAMQIAELCWAQAKSTKFRELSLDSAQSGNLSDWLSRCGVTVPPSITIQDGNTASVQVSAFNAVISSPETVKHYAEIVDLSSAAERLAMKRDRARNDTTYEFSTVTCTDTELYINAGGPVWGLCFAPEDAVVSGKAVSGRRCRNKQVYYSRYLAVGLSRFGWPSPRDSVDVKIIDGQSKAEAPSSSNAHQQSAARSVTAEATTEGRYGVGSDYQRNIGDADTSDNILQIWCIGGEVQVNGRSAEQPWAVPTLESAVSTMVASSFADSDESSEEDTGNAAPAQSQARRKPSGRFKTPEELAAAKAAGKASGKATQPKSKRQRVYDADGNVVEMRGKWKRLPGKGKSAVELEDDGSVVAKPKKKSTPRKRSKREEESDEDEDEDEEEDDSTDSSFSGDSSSDEQAEDEVPEVQTNKRRRSAAPEPQDAKGGEAPPAKRRGRPPKAKPVDETAVSDTVQHVLLSNTPAAAGASGAVDPVTASTKDVDTAPAKSPAGKPPTGKPRGRPRKKPLAEETEGADKGVTTAGDAAAGGAKVPPQVNADAADDDDADADDDAGQVVGRRGKGRKSAPGRVTAGSEGQLVHSNSDSDSGVDKKASAKGTTTTMSSGVLTGADADAAIERAILSDDGTKTTTAPNKGGRKPKAKSIPSQPAVSSAKGSGGNAKEQQPPRSTSLTGSRKEPTARLAYCVALNKRGPTWGLCWSPASLSCSGSSSLLGALAVVCGDGSCLVLVLPRPAVPTNTPSPLDAPLFEEAAVCRCEIRFEQSMISCASWDPHRPLQLVCGMMDGSVTVWNLAPYLRQEEDVVSAVSVNFVSSSSSSSSTGAPAPSSSSSPPPPPPLQHFQYPVRLSRPIMQFVDAQVDDSLPAFAAVRSVQVCPSNRDLILVSGCADNYIKIWHRTRLYLPVFRKTGYAAAAHAEWDPTGMGIYFCSTDETSVTYDSLGNFPTAKTRVTLYSHVNRFGAAWKVHSLRGDGASPFLLSVSSDGSVRGGFAPNLVMPKVGATSEMLIELFRALDVTTVRENGESGSSSNGSATAGKVLVSGATDVFTPENYGVEAIGEKNSVALHAIDSTLLYEASRDVIFKCGAQHLVAFGGAAGIVKVQTFNPLKQMLERSKR